VASVDGDAPTPEQLAAMIPGLPLVKMTSKMMDYWFMFSMKASQAGCTF
jgi:hypothetical protein